MPSSSAAFSARRGPRPSRPRWPSTWWRYPSRPKKPPSLALWPFQRQPGGGRRTRRGPWRDASRSPSGAGDTAVGNEFPLAGEEATATAAEGPSPSSSVGPGAASGGEGGDGPRSPGASSLLGELHRRLAESARRCYPAAARRFQLQGRCRCTSAWTPTGRQRRFGWKAAPARRCWTPLPWSAWCRALPRFQPSRGASWSRCALAAKCCSGQTGVKGRPLHVTPQRPSTPLSRRPCAASVCPDLRCPAWHRCWAPCPRR